jgi:isopenicillin N synthase-like dioxygenase
MTADTQFDVPIIDISPYVRGGSAEEKARVAAEMDAACRTVGFIQVVGHGIPVEASDGLAAAIDEFFALPLDVKKHYVAPRGINRGYTAPKTERLSLSLGVEKAERMNDFFEAFNVGFTAADYPHLDLGGEAGYAENIWPEETTAFEGNVNEWLRQANGAARVLTRIFADALKLDEGFFDEYIDHSLSVLRMNNYALPDGEKVTLDQDLIGMGEHTDFGIVTLLWADDVKGLQVLGRDGDWHDVSPAPGALLVNLGDLTNRWTNERWMSTLHRVKPPVIDGAIRRRRSAAFFLDGNIESVISTLPGMVEPGQTELYPPITVGDHITAKLEGSRGLVSNVYDTERDAARVEVARS